MLDVHTIAAGGDRFCILLTAALPQDLTQREPTRAPLLWHDGPLTLTDVQVLLGHLRPDTLPPVFGHDGRGRIDTLAVAGSSPPSHRK